MKYLIFKNTDDDIENYEVEYARVANEYHQIKEIAKELESDCSEGDHICIVEIKRKFIWGYPPEAEKTMVEINET